MVSGFDCPSFGDLYSGHTCPHTHKHPSLQALWRVLEIALGRSMKNMPLKNFFQNRHFTLFSMFIFFLNIISSVSIQSGLNVLGSIFVLSGFVVLSRFVTLIYKTSLLGS